ncbi:MAG: GntR family transcriptional regulator [Deltaproteobacteria bacterium]|nr:GntR family transcriptional regulator [Deltaproteobacteria bacterium]
MLPFRLHLKPGESPYRQVIYAVKKAIASRRMRPGDPFPSVRKLSQALKINPNTAHKAVAALIAEGLLEVRPGIGTTVAEAQTMSTQERRELLNEPLEHLVVEAKRLGLSRSDLAAALEEHWALLSSPNGRDESDDKKGTTDDSRD